MEFSEKNLLLANKHFAGQGGLFFPVEPERQPQDGLDLHESGPVLLALYEETSERYCLQWLSRAAAGLANDWEEYDSFDELQAAIQEDAAAFPCLLERPDGWLAASTAWW